LIQHRRQFDRHVTAARQRRVDVDARERADLVIDRRAARSKKVLDGVELFFGERQVNAEPERLRDRRADAGEHRKRAADRRPDCAGRRIGARLRIDERGVAAPFGPLQAAGQRDVGKNRIQVRPCYPAAMTRRDQGSW
jgi:hypothetical protein